MESSSRPGVVRQRRSNSACAFDGHARGLRRVLVVGHVLAPRHWRAGLVVLRHGNVGHEAVGGDAVPVVLAGLEEDAVTGADDLDGTTLALAEPTPSLTKIVGPCGWVCQAVRVPGVKCTHAAAKVEVSAGAATASM
jgi:hypothetical protein